MTYEHHKDQRIETPVAAHLSHHADPASFQTPSQAPEIPGGSFVDRDHPSSGDSPKKPDQQQYPDCSFFSCFQILQAFNYTQNLRAPDLVASIIASPSGLPNTSNYLGDVFRPPRF
jgi:hypothetical protein